MTTPRLSTDEHNNVSHRSVLAIAVPMTLAGLSTPLLGIVDTAVIGQLGSAALIGGIAIGGIIFDLVFTTFNFLRSGTTGLTAQALGANSKKEIVATLIRALMVGIAAGMLVIALHSPLLSAGLYFMGGSEETQAAARAYFAVRIYSGPFLLGNYVVLGWILGLGRATTGLVLQLFLNGLNIVLSIWFVMELNWGVTGVALATLISEAVTFVVGVLIAIQARSKLARPSLQRIFNRRQFARLVALNRDIMIRSFSLIFAFAFFASRSAVQGDIVLAANTILEKFFLMGGYFLDGFATAAEQIAGRSVGARNRRSFDRTVKLTLIWGAGMSLILCLVFLALGSPLIELMTTNELVRQTAETYLIWAALTPLFGFLAFQMDGIFIGATWSGDMRNMMLLSLVFYLVAYATLFPLLGNHGLWLAFEIFLCIRGIALYFILPRRAKQTFLQPARA
ncbi:MAG: MATE family efflux transporter [Stappiaceae bacterium]